MGGGPDEPVSLLDLLVRPAWMRDALCREFPLVNFHPERGEPVEPAKAICRRCLVIAECGAYAVGEGIGHGIWGGMAPRARQELSQSSRAA